MQLQKQRNYYTDNYTHENHGFYCVFSVCRGRIGNELQPVPSGALGLLVLLFQHSRADFPTRVKVFPTPQFPAPCAVPRALLRMRAYPDERDSAAYRRWVALGGFAAVATNASPHCRDGRMPHTSKATNQNAATPHHQPSLLAHTTSSKSSGNGFIDNGAGIAFQYHLSRS
jgi:hypothetical protein